MHVQIYVYVCVRVNVCARASVCVCVCVHMYTCVYICKDIYLIQVFLVNVPMLLSGVISVVTAMLSRKLRERIVLVSSDKQQLLAGTFPRVRGLWA